MNTAWTLKVLVNGGNLTILKWMNQLNQQFGKQEIDFGQIHSISWTKGRNLRWYDWYSKPVPDIFMLSFMWPENTDHHFDGAICGD